MRRTLIAIAAATAFCLAAMPEAALAAKGEPEIVSPPKPLAAFALSDHLGAPFANDRMTGKWSLMLLGFTQCPDVCPFTLQNLTLVIEQLSLHVSPARLPQVVCSIWRRKPREAPIRLAAV